MLHSSEFVQRKGKEEKRMVISPAFYFPLPSPHLRGSCWSCSMSCDGDAAAAGLCVAGREADAL